MLTPNELRELADEMDADKHSPEFFAAVTRTAADAWEVGVMVWQDAYDERDRAYNVLVKRLEAAERFIRWLPREAWDVGDGPKLRRAALAGKDYDIDA